VIPTGRDFYLTKVLEKRLSVGICRILAELLHSSKLESRILVGPRRIPTELPCLSYEKGSRQAGRPSEPCQSPDKATPSYYTKNESFASGISEMWCVLISTKRGVFIGVQGGVTDLVKSITHQVVASRPSHIADRPCGPTFSTTLAFPFSCRHVCTKPRAKPT
jgi:hypothetical protein